MLIGSSSSWAGSANDPTGAASLAVQGEVKAPSRGSGFIEGYAAA